MYDYFSAMGTAYEHNGDGNLLRQLGLRTGGFSAKRISLGTVVLQGAEEQTSGNPPETKVCPARTIEVEVTALPAQFWQFTITRPRDEIEELGTDGQERLWRVVYEPVERFKITTGTGGFTDYWPIAKAVAENMVDIERLAD